MSLITMYANAPCGALPYTKAIVPAEAKGFFQELGFQENQPDPTKEKKISVSIPEPEATGKAPESYVETGDKGTGAPGSYEWNKSTIKQGTKTEIIALIKSKCGADLKRSMLLKTLRKKALKILKDKYNGNG